MTPASEKACAALSRNFVINKAKKNGMKNVDLQGIEMLV